MTPEYLPDTPNEHPSVRQPSKMNTESDSQPSKPASKPTSQQASSNGNQGAVAQP